MKQTAVEWLIGRFHYEGFIGTYCSEEQIKSKRQIMIEIIEQAKEMEKEQIIDFGYDIADDLACGKYRDKKHMEERYNEYLTYKSEQ